MSLPYDKKFQGIFDEMEYIIYISDPDTYEILYVNKITENSFSGKILGKKCYKVFQNLDEPCPFCTNDKLFGENAQSPYVWDFHNKKLDKWFHIIDQAIDWDGKKVRFEMAEDITDKKKLQIRIKKSQSQLDSVLTNLKDSVFVISEDHRILFNNQFAKDNFGENLIGKKCYKILKQQEKPCKICLWQKLKNSQKCLTRFQEELFIPSSDKVKHFDIVMSKIDNYNGQKAVVELLRDITNIKKSEQILQESEKKYKNLVEGLDEALYRMNIKTGEYEYFSPVVEKIFGYSVQNFLNNPMLIKEIIHPDFQNYFKQKWENLQNGIVEPIYEYKIIDKKSNSRWIIQSNNGIENDDGQLVAIEGICRDITEQKRNQKAIQEQKEWLSTTLKSIGDGVIATDEDAKVVFMNAVAENLTGWDENDAQGKSIDEIFKIYNQKTGEIANNPVNRVLKEGKIVVLANHTVLESKNGTKKNIADSGAPIKNNLGNILGVVLVFRDVTEEYEMREQLKAFNEDLEYKINERTKEIKCLYDISRVLQGANLINNTMLQIVERIPPSFQYPEITVAKITYNNMEYKSNDYRNSKWKLVSDIEVKEKKKGYLQVNYLKEKPREEFGSFFKEEKELIDGITEMIGRFIEHHLANIKLEESEKRFSAIFHYAAVGIAQVSTDGEFIKVNQRLCEILGYNRENLLNLTFQDITYPEDLDKDLKNIQSLLDGEADKYNMEKRYLSKSDEIIWALITVSLVRDAHHKPNYFVSIIKDISKRKEVERELKKKEKLYRTIAQNLPNGIVHVFNENFEYIYNAGEELEKLGLNNELLIGKTIYDILDEDIAEFVASKYEICLKENKAVTFEGNFDNQTFLINAIPIEVEPDNPSQILVLSVNISDRKKMEDDLRVLNRELKRSNQELEQFAYVASHDLQEPLRMVASFTQLLQKRYQDKLDEDANEFIDFAVDGAKRMQDLINDLLIFSRVGTRGKSFKTTDMNEVVEKVKLDLKPLIEETKTEISLDSLPLIKADESQMRQILQNLISNSIKFRKEDEAPHIRISSKEDDTHWIFSVKDNGIGIKKDFFDRIFIIFQRLHKKSEYGGTGIGLAVCKKIVRRHGGNIWVESQKQDGSTFYFSISKNVKKKFHPKMEKNN